MNYMQVITGFQGIECVLSHGSKQTPMEVTVTSIVTSVENVQESLHGTMEFYGVKKQIPYYFHESCCASRNFHGSKQTSMELEFV